MNDSSNGSLLQEELGYLRALWEMVERVLSKFGEWYTTLWDKINVDQLLEHNKALSKDVKTLNKAVRVYDVYGCADIWLTVMISNSILNLSHFLRVLYEQ